MGLGKKHGCVTLLQDVLRETQLAISGLRMAEFGNQQFRKDTLGVILPAKRVFEALGVKHVSFDLNGKDGALRVDLGRPIPKEFHGQFDLVTNFGTMEHVEGQEQCWQNIHDLCRPGGYMVHSVPEVGSWSEHCKYHYTQDTFIREVAKRNYEILILRRNTLVPNRHLIEACFQKKEEAK